MPSVNVSGVGIVNFPDGMSPEDITRIIENEIIPASKRKPTDRTFGEAATDIYAGLKGGVGSLLQLPSQLAGVVGGEYEKPGEETGLAAIGKEFREEAEAMKSPGLKAREAGRATKVAEAEKKGQMDAFFAAFSETIKDPGLLTNFLAEQAPQLIPSLGAARLIKPLAGTAAAVRGAVGTGAIQQGADIAAGTYEQVYKELIKQGINESEAAGSALAMARLNGVGAVGLSLLAQRLPGARAIEEAFAGQKGQLGRILGGARGALGEAVSEVAEETPARFLQNLAMAQVNPETSLTAGLGETAGMAAVGGLGLGGGAGLLQRQARTEEAPPTTNIPSQFAPTPEPEAGPPLYEEEQFRKKYAPQPIEQEVATLPPADEEFLTYGAVTEQIDELKSLPQTAEVIERLRQLEDYKAKLSESYRQLANRLSEEEKDQSLNQILADFEQKTRSLQRQKQPKSEEQIQVEKDIAQANKELAQLQKEAKEKSTEVRGLEFARGPKYNLSTFLKGKLTRDDVIDINPDKKFRKYIAPKDAARFDLSDMVANGQLDQWLPPRMRSDVETFDEQDSTEYIKEKLRSDDFRPYSSEMDSRIIDEEMQRIDERIKQLEAAKNAMKELPAMTAEERQQEAAALAAEAGFQGAPEEITNIPEEMQEYYPDMNEGTVSPPQTTEEVKQDQEDQKQAEAASVPNGLDELVRLHMFGKAIGAEPKFKRVQGGVSAGLDFAPNKTLADAVDNNDPEGVIAQLEASKNPFIQRVGNLARNSSPFGIGLYPPNVDRRAKKFSGIYVPSERNVYLRSKATAAVEHVVAHEIVHHLTIDGIRNPTAEQKPAVEKINRLYKHVKSVLSSQGQGKLYALKNVDEFVSEANTNVNFQYQLAKIPYQRQSAWSAFTKFVADLLGFKQSNALTEIIALTDELVSKPGQQAQFKKEEVVGVKTEKLREVAGKVVSAIEGRKPGITPDQGFAHVDPEYLKQLGPIFAPEGKTFSDKMDTYKDRTFQRLAQGIADQYRTIKDYSPLAYVKARMSKTVDGALEGLTFYGQVKLTDGALDIKPNTKGLIETLKPVGNEVNSFLIWLALNRDASLVERGRLASVAPEVVAQRNKLATGKIGNKSRLEVYEEIRKELNKLNKSVLDVALQQGLIDQKSYETFLSDVYYIPFYKMVEEGEVADIRTASGLANKYFSRQLKGGEKPFGDLMENVLRNWNHILSSSMKNDAAVETVKAATEAGAAYPNLKAQFDWRDGQVYSIKSNAPIPAGEVDGVKYAKGELRPGLYSSDGKGLVKVMMNGYPAYYEIVDPLLVESIMSIGYMGPKSKFLDMARGFKNILQYGVTLSPAFKVRNLVRDSVQSAAVSGIGLNIAKNVTDGLAASKKGNPDYISALAGGAIFNFGSSMEGDQARLVKRLIQNGVSGDNILNTESKIKNGLKKMYDAYQELGNRSEAANRMALYKQLRAKGLSHLEASFQARDLLDFSMQGAWPAVRLVTQVIPFLNARTQGLYKLGRDGIIPTGRVLYNSVTGKESDLTDKQKAQQFSIVSGAVVLASLMLYMAFKDDDEYKKREQWDRDNFWWFRLPGMESAIRIPKPFEIGAIGTLAERIAEQMFDEGAEGRVFEQSMKRMLTDTFAINPIPQMIKPLVDLYANKDSFTGAPIESAGMERLSKAERVATNTSPLAKILSQAANVFLPEATEMSPVQADYAIKAYLGWMGATITATSHYAVQPFSKGAYPDHNWSDTISLGFVKSLPANQSGYVTSFYENMKIIEQANADMRHYAELGQSDKVQQILEEKGDKIQLAKFYDKVSKDMSKMRQAIQFIQNDETMGGAQKKEEIDRLKQLIGELAKQAEEVRKSIRK